MGQIVFNGQKPKYCNLQAIQSSGSKANYPIPNGEIWLIDSANSSKAPDGTGKYDSYVIGDGTTIASELVIYNIEDKEYDTTKFSGLGKKVLPKNIVSNKNVLTQAMMNTANTIYHIQYDYDLNEQTITLPAGCVLEFDGGSIKNGGLVGNNTEISAGLYKIFENCHISGSFNNLFKLEWYGAVGYNKNVMSGSNNTISGNLVDSANSIKEMINCISDLGSINLELNSLYFITESIDFPKTVNVLGKGYSSGFIVKIGDTLNNINDATTYALSINLNGSQSVNAPIFKNFAIYCNSTCKLKGVFFQRHTYRSTISNVLVNGGTSKCKEGCFVLSSYENSSYNIFGNAINNCVIQNFSEGDGIYYKIHTLAPEIQNINNNKIQQLDKGVAIYCEPIGETGSGFNGQIYNNELEGCGGGAINLSNINGLRIECNYYEVSNLARLYNKLTGVEVPDDTGEAESYPWCPWVLGLCKSSDPTKYSNRIFGLDFVNNKTSMPIMHNGALTTLKHSINLGYYQDHYKNGISSSVNISDNIFNGTMIYERLTSLGYSTNVSITNNYYTNNFVYSHSTVNVPFDFSTSADFYYKDAIKNVIYKYGNHLCYTALTGAFSNSFITKYIASQIFPVPTIGDSYNKTRSYNEGDIFISGGYVWYCKSGGVLHKPNKCTFTQGSNIINNTAAWAWAVGDVIKSPLLTGGQGTITAKTSDTLTVDVVALKAGDDFANDAIIVPYEYKGGLSGTTSQRPLIGCLTSGLEYFDTTLGKYIYWNGSKWIEADKAAAGVKRSGTFADKPTATDIYVGFKYFCTDKQTEEGATNGIEIIHKGSNVWVDALGRTIS